ncbi:DUF4270 family protein [Aquirufa sp. ROCK2-A2]
MISISSKKLTLNWPVIKWVGILSLFLVSCDAPKEIGSDLFSVEVGLNYTDTLTIKSSTVQIDSIYTSGTNTFTLGSIYHPDFGRVESSFYTQISNADTLFAKSTSVFDSIRMELVYKAYQGDLTKKHTISVYRLTDSLSLSKNYFNNSSISYNPTPLATYSFIPKPIKAISTNGDSLKYDTLTFRLSPAFGKELLSKYEDKTIASGGTGFRNYLKGLYFKTSSEDASSLLGFSSAYSRMSMYFHNPGDTLKYKAYYYFSLSNALTPELQARFNRFDVTRSGNLSNLKKVGDSVPASSSNFITYVQAGTGIATKIEFPYLNNLKGNKNVAVNKAELIIEPADNINYNETLGQLSLVETNSSNRTLRNSYGLLYYTAEGGSGAQSATFDSNTKNFKFNVTSVIQNILSGRIANNGMLITPQITSISATGSAIVSENARFLPINAGKTKLKIYYSYISQ